MYIINVSSLTLYSTIYIALYIYASSTVLGGNLDAEFAITMLDTEHPSA